MHISPCQKLLKMLILCLIFFWGLKSPGRKKNTFCESFFDENFGTVGISFPKASGGVPTAITLPGPACFIDCEVDSHVGARKHGLLTPIAKI